ncbi:MAG: hypothetical protein IT438_16705 [Phycisphaerales bacterium]|nr:hypothetical protein [Phycisphaerales bacterium]
MLSPGEAKGAIARAGSVLAAVIACGVTGGEVRGQPVSFSETEFATWSPIIVLGDNPGPVTGQVGGGNPSPGYVMQHQLTATTPAVTGSYAFHAGSAIYRPDVSGPIRSVSWSEEVSYEGGTFPTGDGQGNSLMCVQDGRVFYADYFYVGTSSIWRVHARSGLTAADFVAFRAPFQPPGVLHPDFSAQASAIRFGVHSANSQGPGGGAYVAAARIDNWMVTVVPCCPADINCTGDVSVQDIFDFLAFYFASDPRGDFNGVGGHSVQDIFDFLAAYFAGCP